MLNMVLRKKAFKLLCLYPIHGKKDEPSRQGQAWSIKDRRQEQQKNRKLSTSYMPKLTKIIVERGNSLCSSENTLNGLCILSIKIAYSASLSAF